ncbi:P-loop containing nucleoside triphosphate hydrolase protein [Coemansia spiralis]|nr:P-loop containing nucleoside triphosphate hydrolase protein [Coemansia spiralis]
MGAIRQLEYSDLFRLGHPDQPMTNWKRYMRYRKPDRPLATTVAMTFTPELLMQAALGIFHCFTLYTGPFFLQRILRFIENSSNSNKSDRSIYVDAFGLLFFSLFTPILYHQLLWVGRHISFCLGGLLVAELSTKTLRRRGKGSWDEKNEDASKSGSSDSDNATKTSSSAADGKIMNLLTADSKRVSEFASYLHNVYSLPFTFGIGVWYMYRMLGVSALIGITVSALYAPLSKKFFAGYTRLRKKQSSSSDERISVITELLQGIKIVKLFGWESRFVQKVDERRERQLGYVWKLFLWETAIQINAYLGPLFVIVIIFTAYVAVFGNTLTAEIAFTSISVFQVVGKAMGQIPTYINKAISGYVAVCRIDLYLGQPQIQDLEKRVSLKPDNTLGFECADLEWGRVEDASSSVSVDDQTGSVAFSLRNIDVQFPIGGLSIIAGPTGSGKSSLLSALIGEMTLTRGRVLLPTVDASVIAASDSKYRDVIELSNEGLAISDIAYVAQEAWLRNATIRENILFGEPYNKDRYEQVLRACALKPDLRILKAGDMTEIGERGVTLSGGQKQRVALARAVYSSRRILLIDDCLSAVDAHTGKHILMECLLNKASIMEKRTCVLVTHHVAMCLPFAQFLVVMKNGQISLKGTPMELQMRGLISNTLLDMQHKDNSTTNGEPDDIKDALGKPAGYKSDYIDSDVASGIAANGINPNSDLSAIQGILIAKEEREEGYVKFDVWKTFMSACGNKLFWLSIIAAIIISEVILALKNYWIRVWVASARNSTVDFHTTGSFSLDMIPGATLFHMFGFGYSSTAYIGPPTGLRGQNGMLPTIFNSFNSSVQPIHHSSTYWLGIYVLFGLLEAAWLAFMSFIIFYGGLKASRIIHKQLIRSIVHATPRFFDTTPIGRIVSRFSGDMQTIDYDAPESIKELLVDGISALTIYIIISSVFPAFTLVAIATSLVYAGIAYYYLNTSRELKRLESNSMSPLLSLFSELIQGVSTIRAFGTKYYYIKESLNCINAHNRALYTVWATNRWLSLRIDIASVMISFTCALFILFNLDWVDAGLAGFILSYALSFSEDMVWVIRSYSDSELNMNSVERVRQYMITEPEAALESSPEHKPSSSWPTKGEVQVKNLVAEYTPGVPVLHDISFSVKHGEKIGVVGRTGAGKSTLSLALLRFVEASGGRIVLDGIDISKIGLEDLRRNVTIIPQDPVLFNGTIRFNLDPFNEYPDEIVWDALRRTHLVREHGSHSSSSAASISTGEDGIEAAEPLAVERMSGIFSSLDAEIKENGQSLSLGQRQLVALARALVRRSRLIIMDEATASVDFDTDDRIQRTIRGYEFADSTLFCIAHRLRTIIDYDRVLVLDKGRVAELDTPYNLLQNKDGIFRSMCENSGEYEHLITAANRQASNRSI